MPELTAVARLAPDTPVQREICDIAGAPIASLTIGQPDGSAVDLVFTDRGSLEHVAFEAMALLEDWTSGGSAAASATMPADEIARRVDEALDGDTPAVTA